VRATAERGAIGPNKTPGNLASPEAGLSGVTFCAYAYAGSGVGRMASRGSDGGAFGTKNQIIDAELLVGWQQFLTFVG